MKLEIGQNVTIQSYKHDGSLHRTWLYSKVLDIKEDHFVVVNNKTWVVEADGRRWFTREPAVCFFYTNRWYNIISMIRKNGIYYYCNLASPSLYDGEAIKNIDYDLDVKVFPDQTDVILDEDEYLEHGKTMNYSEDVKAIVEHNLEELLKTIRSRQYPFDESVIQAYFRDYLAMMQHR
jgi:protein associated with RNAse G/E